MRFNPDDYVDVSDRINRFWAEYPDGAIRTELASPASAFTEVVFRAEVYKQRENPQPDAVGYAAEKPGNGANQTSWHENCETSAIGRALANMGYATSQKDRPSRQEMQKVNRGQQAAPPRETPQERGTIAPGVGMTDQQRKAIWAIATKERAMTDTDVELMSMSMFGVELKALDKQQASTLIETLKQTGEAVPHPKVQQAIDTRESNWIAAMEGAATMGELNRIAGEIAGAKVASDGLRAAFTKHRDRVNERQLVAS